MHELTIQAEVRKQVGRGTSTLRRMGKIPGIYYSAGEENIPLAVAEKSLKPFIYTSEAYLVNLTLDNGVSKKCILRHIDFDPITDKPIHFDFQGLQEDRKITIDVPVIITGGTPQGVRDGGILQHILHTLKVSCLPKYIPDHIEINAEALKINHFIHAGDITIENVTILDNPTSAVVGVVPPQKEVEAATATAGAEEITEPEVIAKGKKVEEGEEGAEGEAGAGEKKAEAAPAKEVAKGKEKVKE
jgi:large subunit ribosomal protein L25